MPPSTGISPSSPPSLLSDDDNSRGGPMGLGNRCGRRIFHWRAADHNFTLLEWPLDLCLLSESPQCSRTGLSISRLHSKQVQVELINNSRNKILSILALLDFTFSPHFNTLKQIIPYPYTIYHIPYTIYHIPYTIYHIPYTIYHILISMA